MPPSTTPSSAKPRIPAPLKKFNNNTSSSLSSAAVSTTTQYQVQQSPKGSKTFNLTLGGGRSSDFDFDGDDEYVSKNEDFDTSPQSKSKSSKAMAKRQSPAEAKQSFSNSTYTGAAKFERGKDANEESKEQAALVARMLGADFSAGDIAARYDMSDSESESDEENYGGGNDDAEDEVTSEQLKSENQTLKAELIGKKTQIKKLGIMLNILEPLPGVDATKMLSILDDKGEHLHHDLKDLKIVSLSKKLRSVQFELIKEKGLGKKAEVALLMLDSELTRKQSELDSLATPKAREMIMKSIVNGTSVLEKEAAAERSGSLNEQLKRSNAQLEKTKVDFEIFKEKNRLMEYKLLQEVGHENSIDKILDDGWKGRAQQVVLLKSKIKRLEANAKLGISGDLNLTAGQQRVNANNLKKDVDYKAQLELDSMSTAKNTAVEELSKSYAENEQKLERVTMQLKAAKSRVGCLESDNSKMREGMKVFLGKADSDDKFVEMLKTENGALKKKLMRSEEREMKTRVGKGKSENGSGGGNAEGMKAQIIQLTNQNSHQERIINQLRAENHRMRNPEIVKSRQVLDENGEDQWDRDNRDGRK